MTTLKTKQLTLFDLHHAILSKQLVDIGGSRIIWRQVTDVTTPEDGLQRGTVVVAGVVYTVERHWPVGDRIWRPVEETPANLTLVEIFADGGVA